MTTLHTAQPGVIACSKGALEVILDSCAMQLTDIGETMLDAPADGDFGSGSPDGKRSDARIGRGVEVECHT